MKRDKSFNPSLSAHSSRNASTLPIPSRAWVKTLETLANMTTAPKNSNAPKQRDQLTEVAAVGLPEQRTAASHGDRHSVHSVPRGRMQSDTVLGIVASGTLLVMLAWIVTGIELLAFIGALVAAASATFAFASTAFPRSAATETGPRADPALPRGLPPTGNSLAPSGRHQ